MDPLPDITVGNQFRLEQYLKQADQHTPKIYCRTMLDCEQASGSTFEALLLPKTGLEPPYAPRNMMGLPFFTALCRLRYFITALEPVGSIYGSWLHVGQW